MPYIDEDARMRLASGGALPDTAGELNYAFTILLRAYYEKHGLSYQTINDIVGALEGAKLEFNRRIVAPYEDGKIWLNGDVY